MTVGKRGWERGRVSTGDGKSRGSARKSLRLAKLRNMETPEPISRNRAADIGGWGAGGRSEGGGGICKYFSNPRGKPRLPFPPPSFFLSLLARRHRAYRSRRSLFPLARRFFAALYRALFTPFFLPLYLFLSFDACEKKKERGKKGRTRTKAKVGNRCALSISGSALFSSPRASSSLPPFLSSRHVSGFAYWKEARWFSPQCYPLCIVHPECALNTSSRAGISASGLFLSRALEMTSRLISGVSSSSSITKFRR